MHKINDHPEHRTEPGREGNSEQLNSKRKKKEISLKRKQHNVMADIIQANIVLKDLHIMWNKNNMFIFHGTKVSTERTFCFCVSRFFFVYCFHYNVYNCLALYESFSFNFLLSVCKLFANVL